MYSFIVPVACVAPVAARRSREWHYTVFISEEGIDDTFQGTPTKVERYNNR